MPPKGADEGDSLLCATPVGRPKGLPCAKLGVFRLFCRGGACPFRLWRFLLLCRARPTGRTASYTDGRPQGSPLQDGENMWEAWKPRAAQCAAPTKLERRLRIRRSPEPHLSPPTQKARFQPVGALPKGYRTLSGSGDRRGRNRLSHPRLCVNGKPPHWRPP